MPRLIAFSLKVSLLALDPRPIDPRRSTQVPSHLRTFNFLLISPSPITDSQSPITETALDAPCYLKQTNWT
jgi:hypothetical protein